MTLDGVRALVQADLDSVDQVIRARMKSVVPLVDEVVGYIMSAGGKRLRPLLVVLVGRACGHSGHAHVEAAAFLELLHTATLLHDDVVDGSSMRRGRDTANEVFGDRASVHVGDFVCSRAFQMVAALNSQPVMQIMAEAINEIAEGEVLQLAQAHDPDTTEERYLEVIYRKTAKLFEAGAAVAAVLAESPSSVRQAAASYGRHLGTAYQLMDDVLDYRSDPTARGKNLGDDLAEGKPTLPLIHALKYGNELQRSVVRGAIEQGGLTQLDSVMAAIRATGSLDYAARQAYRESERALAALDGLPDSPYTSGLAALARFAVQQQLDWTTPRPGIREPEAQVSGPRLK